MAEHVGVDQLLVLLVVRDRVRPRPDDRHLAAQHVEELGELVERGASHEGSDARDPRIVLLRLRDACAVLRDRHRSELPDVEFAPSEPVAALPEEHRALARRLDRDRAREHRRRAHREEDRAEHDVLDPLEDLGPALIEGRAQQQPAHPLIVERERERERHQVGVLAEVVGAVGLAHVARHREQRTALDRRIRCVRQDRVLEIEVRGVEVREVLLELVGQRARAEQVGEAAPHRVALALAEARVRVHRAEEDVGDGQQ